MGTRKHTGVSWVNRSYEPGSADSFGVASLQGSLTALSEAAPYVGPTFPGTPQPGDSWIDTALSQFKVYFGGIWVAVGGGGASMNGTGGTVTIAAGQALSPALDTGGLVLGGLLIPSGWTTAVVTFQAAPDGVNYADVYDDQGNEVQVSAAPGRSIGADVIALVLGPWRYLKLRSGTAASPVAQAAAALIRYALVSR